MSKHPAEQLRDKVADAALALLTESGLEGLSPENIVQRARIDPGEFPRLFPEKHALWSALLLRVHHRLMYLVEHAAVGRSGSLGALERMFHSHVSFIAKNPAVPKLLLHLSQTDDPSLRVLVARIIADYESGLSVLINRAKAEGQVRADVDTRAAAMLFITMIHGLVLRALMTGETQTLMEGAISILPVYLDGIRSGAPRRSGDADD